MGKTIMILLGEDQREFVVDSEVLDGLGIGYACQEDVLVDNASPHCPACFDACAEILLVWEFEPAMDGQGSVILRASHGGEEPTSGAHGEVYTTEHWSHETEQTIGLNQVVGLLRSLVPLN